MFIVSVCFFLRSLGLGQVVFVIEFWPLTIVGIFFFIVLFSLFGFPPEIGMEGLDQDCTLNIEKILVGNDLGSKFHNTAPDVATVGLTSILHRFPSDLSLNSSARVLFLIASSLLNEAFKIKG